MTRTSSRLRTAGRWARRIAVGILIAVAALLIGFRSATALRERQLIEQAAPAAGRHVAAADVRMYVQEAGPADGPPVLLVHGTGAWSEIWRGTMTALGEAGFRAIAIDVPPFGFSSKPAGADAYSPARQAGRIVAALDALGLERVSLVGHSVGGRPTVETALQAPGRVQRLVLVDPALGFGAEGTADVQQNQPTFLVTGFFQLRPLRNAVLATIATNPLTTRTMFKSFVSNVSAVNDERVRMLQQPLAVENLTNAEGDWLEYLMVAQDQSRVSDFRNLGKLTMPVLLIWGRTDTVTPLWQAHQLQRLIPGAELSVLDGVGHIPYIEDADAFNKVLVQWLQTAK